MRRSFILLICFCVMLAVMAFGMTGTGAWFTDQVTLENNLISTGNIDLIISDALKLAPSLEPGGEYQELLRFCARNGGSYDMKWRGMFTSVDAPDGMAELIKIRAVMNPTGLSGNYGQANSVWFTDVSAADLMTPNQFIFVDSSVSDPFKPNHMLCLSLQAKLDPSASNEIGYKTFVANLQLDATQWINPEFDPDEK